MRLRVLALAIVVTMLGLAAPALASTDRALVVSTSSHAVLLSPRHAEVRGSLTCPTSAEQGTVGVVLVQPPRTVAQDGGGSTPFACSAGETVRWAILVTAFDSSTFNTGRARFSTYANTPCSDDETDCPSSADDGILKLSPASRRDGVDVSPGTLRFGRQPFESLTKMSFTIRNTGSRTLEVSIETTVVPDDFSPGQPESTCPLAGVGVNVLLPGQSCTHVVAFQPARVFDQPEHAMMTITSKDLSGAVVDVSRLPLNGRGY